MNKHPRSSIDHRGWMRLAAEEYRRLDAVIADLDEAEWARPTECDGWQVRDIVAHLIGAAEATASTREQLRQQRAGARSKGDRPQIDAVNDLQISERAALSASDLRALFADATARGLRARTRTPAPIRAVRMSFPPPVGRASLGFLTDIVYTRDAWMHRIDICRAIGIQPELTTDHDAVIIADAAEAWHRVTGHPIPALTGLAATSGAEIGGAPTATYDALEFARALSGRGRLAGVAADVVLF